VLEADALALGLMIATAIFGALVTTGAAPRRAVGLVAALGAFAAPTLAAPMMVRGILGLLQLLLFIRAVDLFRERRALSVAQRLWHVFSIVDSRLLAPVARSFDAAALLRFLGWSALGLAGAGLAWRTGNLPGRWLGGVLLAYSLVEALWAFVRCIYAALGLGTPVLHALPLASRSVQELWGERWATPVRRWLRATCFTPLARRGWPRLGVGLAFLASALLHAYVVFICVGTRMAALMLAYFLVQAGVVVVERALRVSSWRAGPAHAWVIATMLLTAPLFTEPLLRCVGM
jgi:hypothetical protein